MKKSDVIAVILDERLQCTPRQHFTAESFAPSNIALCKYWGKRDQVLNLPMTSSLSVSLNLGSRIKLAVSSESADKITLNGQRVIPDSPFAVRLTDFVNLFRAAEKWFFTADIMSDIPIGAGLASSACGFAALTLALDQLFDWQLDRTSLSLLARLGSGSACRSLWRGFVEWQKGERADGMDSHGVLLDETWPELCIGLLVLSESEKPVTSRVAMQLTVETSLLYRKWPEKVSQDLGQIKTAIQEKDFALLGSTAESNALAMHASMREAGINYCLPETLAIQQKILQLRDEGLPLYFTQDAGPNLKLIFPEEAAQTIRQQFSEVAVMKIFSDRHQ